MPSKLIRVEGDILIEADVDERGAQPISNRAAERVEAAIDGISDILLRATQPIASVWKEANKDMLTDETEIELGLGFEAEGNIYITKAKGNANLIVRLKLKPNPNQQENAVTNPGE